MNRISVLFSLLAIFYTAMSHAECPLKPTLEEKASWVLEPNANRVLNSYYQKCLKGDNSMTAVKKFIDCMETSASCRVNQEPGFCDNYCKDGAITEPTKKDEPKVAEPISEPAVEPASALKCSGGSESGGKGTCSIIVDNDPNKINLLSFNLYWWAMFDKGDFGKKILGAIKSKMLPADLMALQECSDVRRVLDGAGLSCYESYDAGHAVALAWNPQKFEKISANRAIVGLDLGSDQWSLTRVVGFVRLKVKATGKVIFLANVHGVLPVNIGGIPIRTNCETLASMAQKNSYIAKYKKPGDNKTFARNIVEVINANIQPGDILIFAGDFNIDKDNSAENPFNDAYKRIAADWVDKIFIQKDAQFKNIAPAVIGGDIGSDHRALRVVFSF